MVLLAAVILPHGAMPYDGDPDSSSPACRDRYAKLDPDLRNNLSTLYTGTCEASQTIADLKPDLIILNSPHGISLSDAYGVYMNYTANGNALWLDQWSEFTTDVKIDSVKAKAIKDQFESNGIAIQGIRTWGGIECKLRWGEVIPSWYLKRYLTNEPPFVVLTNDLKPKPDVIEDWRVDAGRVLAKYIDGIPDKVVVVISGDLSHYHYTDCTNPLYLPDPSSDFPANPEGALAFETSIAQWVTSGNSYSSGDAKSQVWDPVASYPYIASAVPQDLKAGSCGMKGFVLLHGLLADEVERGAAITSQIVVKRAPTYYGMMAATFIKSK